MATPVSVGELQQAWIAVARGDFRTLPPAEPWPKGSSEQRLLVVGVAGQMGTSTVALALAEDRGAARLVDCAPTSTSGLVGVCDRELGRDANGWWEGHRRGLLVQRSPLHTAAAPDACPQPPAVEAGLTVVDAGFPAPAIAASPGWLADLLNEPTVPVVVVTRCSVPGMRLLASTLHLIQGSDRQVRVIVQGPSRQRWPRGVQLPTATGDPTTTVTTLPTLGAFATAGLGAPDLPAAITAAVHACLQEGSLR